MSVDNTEKVIHGWEKADFFRDIHDIKRVKYFLERNSGFANLLMPYETLRLSVLLNAIEQFHGEEMVKLFLDHGARFASDEEKETGLHLAVWKCSVPILERLVEVGAKVEGLRGGSETPLHSACYARNIEAVRWLLGKGVNVNAQNRNGMTALHYLYQNEPHGEWEQRQEISKLLINEYHADETLKAKWNGKEYTPADLIRTWLAFMINRTNTHCQNTGYLFSDHNRF